jgi:hypothetical protein
MRRCSCTATARNFVLPNNVLFNKLNQGILANCHVSVGDQLQIMMKGCLGQLSTLTILYVGCQSPDKTDDDFVARHYNNKRCLVNSHPPKLITCLLASNHQRPDGLLASNHMVLYLIFQFIHITSVQTACWQCF